MLEPLNRITKCSVVLGAILLTSMGASFTPAQASVLREGNSLMLHPAFMGISSDSNSSSGTDPTAPTATSLTSTVATDPVPAPEPTYAAGILAFGVLGLGFLWKVFPKAK